MIVLCNECEGRVSSHATACPHCGCPTDLNVIAPPRPGVESLPKQQPLVVAGPAPAMAPAAPQPADTPQIHPLAHRAPPPPAEVIPPLALPQSQWRVDRPAPWSRLAARSIDMLLFSTPFWFLVAFVVASGGPGEAMLTAANNQSAATLISLVVMIPIVALSIGATGASPGKWAFGIRVVRSDGSPIGPAAALEREVDLWIRGLGMGIPLVSLVTQIVAYQTLVKQGHSSWDPPDKRSVRYLNHTWLTRLRAAIAVVLLVFGFIALSTIQ
jgi:uncharacterized RDD family membrane protein YckC